MSKTNNLTDFLTDLADGIRAAEGSTGTINPQDFRTRIENLASGSARPILYGTYILNPYPSFTPPSTTVREQNFSDEDVAAWFYDGSNWEYNSVYSILFTQAHSTTGRHSFSICQNDAEDYSIDWDSTRGWTPYCGDYYEFPSNDERWLIIDFFYPIEVSQEFYDLFMQIVDCSDSTPYSIGYNNGHKEALEALGALCDWMITTDAYSNPMITILNHHPNYYLHCEIYDGVGNSWYDFEDDSVVEDEAVIPPNSSKTFYGEYSLSNIKPVNIDNVRWSANA